MLSARSPKFLLASAFFATLTVATVNSQDSKPASRPAETAATPAKDPAKAQAALTRAVEKNSKKRDYSADFDMRVSVMGMDIKGNGKLMVSAAGKMRQETTTQMPMMGGAMTQTIVNDGKVLWLLQEMPNMPKTVMKGTKEEMEGMQKKMGGGMPGSSSDGQDPAAQLQNLQKSIDFDTLEESVDVDGRQYWAVSGEMKKDALGKDNPAAKMMASMMKRARVLFTKDADVFSGIEFIDTAGKPVVSMTYKNINNEPKFDEKIFTFEPPAGVKVMSMAEMMRNLGSMGGDEEDEEGDEEEESAPATKPAGGK